MNPTNPTRALVTVGALGFVLGGLVVYIVLGDRGAEQTIAVVTTPEESPRFQRIARVERVVPTVPAAAGVAPTLPQPPAVDVVKASRELEERVAEEAHIGLQQQPLESECWNPAVELAPEPSTATYVYDLTFDATGKEVARGISETRGESRGDVARCLMERFHQLRVSPPGRTTQVQVTITLPF